MQLAYIYDHAFAVAGDEIYSSGAFSAESWRRYLSAFDSVLVVAHKIDVPRAKLTSLNRVNSVGVSFKFVPKIRGMSFLASCLRPESSPIAEIVRNADAIAVRQYSNLGCTGVALAKRHRIPYAIEVVDCPYDGYRAHSNPLGSLFAPLARLRLRRLMLNAPFSFYVTRKTLQERYPSRGYTEAASNVMISDVVSAQALDSRWTSNKPSLFKIGIIGHYANGIKGQAVAIEALSRLSSDLTEFRLELVGTGSTRELSAVAKEFSLAERTVFHGQLRSGQPVLDFLDTLDLYIHPSYKEGLPRAVVEAMSRGLPVLASNAGGTSELLNSRYLHTPGDVDTLSQQISEMMANKEHRELASRQNALIASGFLKELLDERREDFWKRFAASVRAKTYDVSG